VSGQLDALAALPRGKKSRTHCIGVLGGPQSQSEPYGEEKILDPTGTRIPTSRSSTQYDFLFEYWRGVHTGSTRHCGHNWLIVPAPDDCEDGEVGGMIEFGRGNRTTRRKPAPTPLCLPQIPLDQTQVRILAAAVVSQRLTA
jgi:hypothetical protein